MKKSIYAMLLVLSLTVTFAFPVMAETILGRNYKACGDNANETLQYGSEDPDVATSIPLKPKDGENPEGAWFDFDVPVSASGDVTFTFLYATNGERYMDVTFNGETKRVVCYDSGNFQTFTETDVTFTDVPAGTLTLRLAAPSDYCDTVKTPNVDAIDVALTPKPMETEPETVATPAAEAVVPAPKTLDYTAIVAVTAILSLVGAAVGKKRG